MWPLNLKAFLVVHSDDAAAVTCFCCCKGQTPSIRDKQTQDTKVLKRQRHVRLSFCLCVSKVKFALTDWRGALKNRN